MGTWSVDSFGNDTAMDWCVAFERDGLAAVEAALQAVLEVPPLALDYWTCLSAVAAAEVVAAMRGRPSHTLPPEVRGWLAQHASAIPDDALTARTRRVVALVLAGSELMEAWDEAPKGPTWRARMADLQWRLAA